MVLQRLIVQLSLLYVVHYISIVTIQEVEQLKHVEIYVCNSQVLMLIPLCVFENACK